MKESKLLFVLMALVFLLSNIYALCDDGQIDINSASAEELQEFTGIGPAKSQEIIDYRDSQKFNSVDELINVNGIGPVTLQNMKDEGACVSSEDDENSGEESKPQEDETKNDNSQEESSSKSNDEIVSYEKENNKPVVNEVINLVPKDIKSESNSESLSANNYAVYILIGFCILLLFLFLAKNRDKKNEFD